MGVWMRQQMKKACHSLTMDVQRSMLAAASCHVEVTPWRDEVGFDVRLVKCPLNAVACQSDLSRHSIAKAEASSEAWSAFTVLSLLPTGVFVVRPLVLPSSDH
jgi:hypothetical protein